MDVQRVPSAEVAIDGTLVAALLRELKFVDSEGIGRHDGTDIAVGVQIAPEQDDLRVRQFERFVSPEGVEWNDPERHSKLYHGQAMRDFVRINEEGGGLEPTKKEEISREPGLKASGRIAISPSR